MDPVAIDILIIAIVATTTLIAVAYILPVTLPTFALMAMVNVVGMQAIEDATEPSDSTSVVIEVEPCEY